MGEITFKSPVFIKALGKSKLLPEEVKYLEELVIDEGEIKEENSRLLKKDIAKLIKYNSYFLKKITIKQVAGNCYEKYKDLLELKQLKKINFEGVEKEEIEETLQQISNKERITSIEFRRVDMKQALLQGLEQYEKLTSLSIKDSKHVEIEKILQEIKNSMNITKIRLENIGLGQTQVQAVLQKLQGLCECYFQGIENLQIEPIFEYLKRMKVIGLRDCGIKTVDFLTRLPNDIQIDLRENEALEGQREILIEEGKKRYLYFDNKIIEDYFGDKEVKTHEDTKEGIVPVRYLKSDAYKIYSKANYNGASKLIFIKDIDTLTEFVDYKTVEDLVLFIESPITQEELKAIRRLNQLRGGKEIQIMSRGLHTLDPQTIMQVLKEIPIGKILIDKFQDHYKEEGYKIDQYKVDTYLAIYETAKEWIQDISITDSEYNRVRKTYKKVIKKLSYDHMATKEGTEYWKRNIDTSRNLENGLLKGKCVCAGYAQIFTQLCLLQGIKCKCIDGYLGKLKINNNDLEGNHAWCQVQVDGNWYWVDPTNEFKVGELHWFLKGDKAFSKTHYPILGEPHACPKNMESQGIQIVKQAIKKIFQLIRTKRLALAQGEIREVKVGSSRNDFTDKIKRGYNGKNQKDKIAPKEEPRRKEEENEK